jgi:hypothetical protein
MSEKKRIYLKPEHEEVLKNRPVAPWIDEVPEGDFVTPYPTYEPGKYFDLFEKKYFEKDGFRMKYYFFDPTKNGYDGKKKHPILIFLHGTSNSLVDDLCINYTGAELYASKNYQDTLGGAYILIPVANEYKDENGKTKGFWDKEYLVPAHALIMNFINEHSENIGKRILFGNSSGGRFSLMLMDNYMDDFDAVIPVGSCELASDEILDKYDEKGKVLFLAMGKHDEFNHYDQMIAPRLDKLKSMKHSFIFTPDWVRNGDKGIASIDGGIEMGQHCLMNAVQCNLMFDDNTPMDERLPKGLTGWIAENIL